jgi:hypothetical protein
MGVFKEEASTFETVYKKSKRIFTDAADFGFPYDSKNPPEEIKAVLATMRTLKNLDLSYPEEKEFVRNRQTWGNNQNGGVSADVIIFWDQDEGYYRGTKYHISFNRTTNGATKIQKECDSFISIDIEPYSEKA